ncbi:TIGR04255 family protein [Anatilimnocola sp. NA78]|uniref:TIGR04255 family protein n=1 Tax=Anatilimnocola sp. NA78 TaxID=3415683 RepID=UPI003CE4BB2B
MPLSAPPDITYGQPPLVEVAMSVQFAPPKGFHLGHFGVLWSLMRGDYTQAKATQPIIPIPDDFGNKGPWLPQTLRLALIDSPECRLQMNSTDERWMCQVQQDRLVVNWRMREGEYPRYDATWVRFKHAWSVLHQLFKEHELEAARPLIWELTYVNRIPAGELWKSPNDWPKVVPGLWRNGVTDIPGARLHGLVGQWVWQADDECARVMVEPKPHKDGPNENLYLHITSRGTFRFTEQTSDSLERIERGLGIGHSMIVTTFDTIVSSDAKKAWKRHDNAH